MKKIVSNTQLPRVRTLDSLLITVLNISNSKSKSKLLKHISEITNFTEQYGKLLFMYIQNIPTQSILWHMDDYTISAAWSLAFYSRIEKNTTHSSNTLKIHGQQTQYTIIPVKFHSHSIDTNIFVKFFEPRHKIYYLIDSINGKVMNYISNKFSNKLSGHVMTYVDSFLHYYSDKTAHNNQPVYEWDIHTLCDINNTDSPFYIPQNETEIVRPKKYYKCNVVISYAVNGDNLIEERKNYEDILEAFPDFVNALLFLGLNHGFLHNDLHSGNIMYDTHKKKLVCIDYGRSHFQIKEEYTDEITTLIQFEIDKMRVELFDKNMRNELSNILIINSQFFEIAINKDKENEKNKIIEKNEKMILGTTASQITYASIMDKINSSCMKSTYKINDKHPMCIMDIITICGNMYFIYLKHTKLPKINGIDTFIKFSHISPSFITVFTNKEKIYNNYCDFKKNNTNIPEYLKIITEGLFYLAMFLSHNSNSNSTEIEITLGPRSDSLFTQNFVYKESSSSNSNEIIIDFCKIVIQNNLLNRHEFVKTSFFLKHFKKPSSTINTIGTLTRQLVVSSDEPKHSRRRLLGGSVKNLCE